MTLREQQAFSAVGIWSAWAADGLIGCTELVLLPIIREGDVVPNTHMAIHITAANFTKAGNVYTFTASGLGRPTGAGFKATALDLNGNAVLDNAGVPVERDVTIVNNSWSIPGTGGPWTVTIPGLAPVWLELWHPSATDCHCFKGWNTAPDRQAVPPAAPPDRG